MIKDQMEKIYKSIPPEKIPWNMESPPDILRALVQTKKISPCKVIELGCGTGNYVIYLSGLQRNRKAGGASPDGVRQERVMQGKIRITRS